MGCFVFGTGAGNFSCLEIVFSFQRRLGYYLFHTYGPTCLIVIMSWISFWINHEATSARVALGSTNYHNRFVFTERKTSHST